MNTKTKSLFGYIFPALDDLFGQTNNDTITVIKVMPTEPQEILKFKCQIVLLITSMTTYIIGRDSGKTICNHIGILFLDTELNQQNVAIKITALLIIKPLKLLVAIANTSAGVSKSLISALEKRSVTKPSIAIMLIVGISRILLFIRVKSTAMLMIIINMKITAKLIFKPK